MVIYALYLNHFIQYVIHKKSRVLIMNEPRLAVKNAMNHQNDGQEVAPC